VIKVGVIGNILDEGHGTYFSIWLNEVTNGEVQTKYAYALLEKPLKDDPFPLHKRTSKQWCADYNITLCHSLEEIVDKSDALMVCAPNNSELHEQLCSLPLASGKPVFCDKVFSTTFVSAKRMFELAETHSTPVFSCSATRFIPEIVNIRTEGIRHASCWYGAYDVHIIHEIEPVMMLMQAKAVRIKNVISEDFIHYIIEFADGRYATMAGYHGIKDIPLLIHVFREDGYETVVNKGELFHNLIVEISETFKSRTIKINPNETLNIIGVYEAAMESRKMPGEWVEIQQTRED